MAQRGYVPVRQTFGNFGWTVGWDPEKQQAILTDPNTGFSTRLSGTIDDSGTMYAPYNQLGSIFAGAATKTRPLTAQDYTQSFDTAKAMWDPLIQPYMESLQEKSRGQMAAIEGLRPGVEAAYSQAYSHLGRQEDKARRASLSSAIARGVYSSGLYDEMQKGITGDYAPEYQQLESNRAAGLAALSGKQQEILGGLASQQKQVEAEMLSRIMQGAASNLEKKQTEGQSRNLAALNWLTGLQQQDIAADEREWTRMLQQAAENRAQEQYDWEKTNLWPLNIQTQRANLARTLAGINSGSGGTAKQTEEKPTYGQMAQGVMVLIDQLSAPAYPDIDSSLSKLPATMQRLIPSISTPVTKNPQQIFNEVVPQILNQAGATGMSQTDINNLINLAAKKLGLVPWIKADEDAGGYSSDLLK
jgi:hypothetical protein